MADLLAWRAGNGRAARKGAALPSRPQRRPANNRSAPRFTGTELITGSIDGRGGSLAIEERGTFDIDATLHCTFKVAPGSGIDELYGLRGNDRFTAKQGESRFRTRLATLETRKSA